jgi:twitching motility two-component system response regulator PilG
MLRGRSEFRETPVLLVSGHDGIVDRVRGRLAGATGYITKPFEMQQLVARVRRLAEGEWRRRQDRAHQRF